MQAIKCLDDRIIMSVATAIKATILAHKKIYVMGNGGSAATAAHICNDFIKQGICAICLNDNTSVLTAIANDISFEDIFSFQVNNCIKENDLLIGFSTSGNSENVCRALVAAKQKGATTISITGFKGGNAESISKYNINVKNDNIQIIEDIHLSISHMLVYVVKTLLTSK